MKKHFTCGADLVPRWSITACTWCPHDPTIARTEATTDSVRATYLKPNSHYYNPNTILNHSNVVHNAKFNLFLVTLRRPPSYRTIFTMCCHVKTLKITEKKRLGGTTKEMFAILHDGLLQGKSKNYTYLFYLLKHIVFQIFVELPLLPTLFLIHLVVRVKMSGRFDGSCHASKFTFFISSQDTIGLL